MKRHVMRSGTLRWMLLTIVIQGVVMGELPPASRAVHADAAGHAPYTAYDLAQYVNPFDGTFIHFSQWQWGGNTFPGADVPFGMVQWSPDTPTWTPGGYVYSDSAIKGFSLTHISGTSCSIYQDIPFMPTVDSVSASPASDGAAYTSTFAHTNEQASPGYYGVRLDSGIQVGLTVTPRTGFGTFTYPASSTANMLINVGGSVNGDSAAEVHIDTTNSEVTGWATSGNFCGWMIPYTVYFAAVFDHPFARFGTWNGSTVTEGSDVSSGGQSGAFVGFDTTQNAVVQMKVGVSFVSVQNALMNLKVENPGWDAAAVSAAARASWNEMFNRVQVSGGTLADTQTFYTALYHALLHPNIFSDVNGQYIGFDNQIHATSSYTQYANYSGWDIYRSEIPLLALLAPDQTSDMMQSLVADAEQSGWLPKWAVANSNTGVMIGDSADPIIASAYALGATRFDLRGALQAMIKGATQAADESIYYYLERPQLNDYLSSGYVPADTPNGQWSAAMTLEYATDDFAIAQFAQALGDSATYAASMQRAQYWQNLFNPANGFIAWRATDGTFLPNFDPTSDWGFDESNSAQYTWMVPHNLHALFAAMGGPQQVINRLDTFFTQLNAGWAAPYAFLSNEHDLQTPWEYDFVGEPWRAQAVVRQAMTQLYAPTIDGLPGSDDLGTMSAWYVWAALGFYPVIPGVADLMLDSPLFPQITLHLAHGDATISAPNASDMTPYVQDLAVNGQRYAKPWLPFSMIANGATLQFSLGSVPNMVWGSDSSAAPPSFTSGEAPAIGFVAPSSTMTILPGNSGSFQLGAQNVTDQPLLVQWSASLPSGLRLDEPTSALTVTSATSTTQTLTVSASTDLAPGRYVVPIQMYAVPIGQRTPVELSRVYIAVTISGQVPTPTVTPSDRPQSPAATNGPSPSMVPPTAAPSTNMPAPPLVTPANTIVQPTISGPSGIPTGTGTPMLSHTTSSALPTATDIPLRASSRRIARLSSLVIRIRVPHGMMGASNDKVMVTIHAAPYIPLLMSVTLTHSVYAAIGPIHHRRRIPRDTLHCHSTIRARTSRTGETNITVRLPCAVSRLVPAMLTVTLHMSHNTVSQSIHVLVEPTRHQPHHRLLGHRHAAPHNRRKVVLGKRPPSFSDRRI